MASKKDTYRQLRSYWSNNMFFLGIAYRTAPRRVVLQFILSMLNYGIDYLYAILFVSYVFGAVEHGTPYSHVLIFIAAMMSLSFLLTLVYEWFDKRYKPVCDLKISQELNRMLFEKASEVELACYEDAEFYDKYTRAGNEADTRMAGVLDNMTNFFGALTSFVLLIFTVIYLDPIALIFMILPAVTKLTITVRRNQALYDLNKANTSPVRVSKYVNRIAYLESFAKELRLSNIFRVMLGRYDQAVGQMRGNFLVLGRRVAKYRALDDVFGRILPFPLAIMYAALSVLVLHRIKAFQFIVMLNAINNLSRSVAEVSGFFTKLQENGIYIENVREFLRYEPVISEKQAGIKPDGEEPRLELDQVGFTYSGASNPILSGISLKVEPGEKIALVGHNGAGKSTLIKLMMRLYDPTEGVVRLNGVAAGQYEVQGYREVFGTVFQDCKVMAMPVADNVFMRRASEGEYKQAEEVLETVGVYSKISSLGGSAASVMTREFDDQGLVLSGGEVQKISIGRLFASDSRIAILDEPSSALDPVAEYQMFELLLQASEGRTVIFISHRLSSAALADRIVLLEHGRIAETGSHDELMARGGKYADMFHKQAAYYKEEALNIG
ncbi:ABC transporter ATP-binding protein [Paenibacillus glycanilyticus]|uniref:HlyB/MsbA family ABC transporter n=1 Tax=Paenibacillus glycanilyticus TaxID=126569 RepID=A0ABQ6GLC8_9BACL|nr:ABC transporter ATP-binding protein [Paenibacillus glycanilyticus]GLX70416.1 HlyB/MsbA family ABC transporter [Paenibacillus glycanilyticus]